MHILGKQDTKFRVCTTIRKILLQDDDVKALVGDKIYPIVSIEEAPEGNFIVYQRDSYSIRKTHQGIYEQECAVFINCVSTDYDESQRMAEAVFNALQNVHNYVDEIDNIIINEINLEDSIEDYAAGKFLQILKFEII